MNSKPTNSYSRFGSFRPWALLVCVLGCYWLVLIYQLGAQWSAYEQYAYGWAVPFLCLYLLAVRTPHSALPNPSVHQSIAFIVLVVCSALLLPIRWLHEANPIWRLTSWAWALCLVGLTLSLVYLYRGGQKAKVHRSQVSTATETNACSATPSPPQEERAGERRPQSQTLSKLEPCGAGARGGIADVLFPICFFLVAVPWPSGLEGPLVQAFARANATAAVEVLNFLRVTAVQHGNVIEVVTGLVGIDEACSGIRSFQEGLMVALFLGQFYSLSLPRRVLCIAAGFLLSFFFNLVRTVVLTEVAAKKGMAAMHAWHDPAGIAILAGCFLALWGVAAGLSRRGQGHRLQGASCRFQVEKPGATDTVQAQDSTLRTPHSPIPQLSTINYQLAAALLVWFLVIEVGVQWWYRSHERRPVSAVDWALCPERLGATARTLEIRPGVSSQLRYDQGVSVQWRGAEDDFWQMYYLRWNPSTTLKRRVEVQLSKSHGPEVCLPASGMKPVAMLGAVPMQLANLSLSVQQYVFEREGQRLHVFYGVYEDAVGPEQLANRRLDSLTRLKAALSGTRNTGQRVLEVAVVGPETPERARELFVRELSPLVSVSRQD